MNDNKSDALNMRSISEHHDKFAVWFLVITLVSGLLIMFFTPPMCSPDENAHFLNAYAVSRGDLFPEIVDGTPGRFVEGRVLTFVQNYLARFTGNLSDKYSFSEQYFNSYLQNTNTEPVFYGNGLNTINPIAYLPAGFSMMIFRFFGSLVSSDLGALPYNLLIYGRLGNLLFFSFVMYYAIRNTRHFRKLFILMAMIPITLFLGASVNYDALLIPVTFLFISTAFNLITDPVEKKLTKNDIFCILFCTFFLVGIKLAYATLLLILLAIPRKKYGSTKRMIQCIAAVCAVGVIAQIPTVVNKVICSDMTPAPYITEQTEYVKTHLWELPGVFINTFRMNKGYYLRSFFGALGQLDTNVPFPFEVVFYLLLFVVSLFEICTTKLWNQQWKRLLPFAAALISFIGLFIYMYLTWTPIPGIADGVGSNYISGVQGRYLIELIIPFISVLCFGGLADNKYVNKAEKVIDRIIYAWTAVCGLITPLIVFIRYWE